MARGAFLDERGGFARNGGTWVPSLSRVARALVTRESCCAVGILEHFKLDLSAATDRQMNAREKHILWVFNLSLSRRLRGGAMYGTVENSGLLDANRRRGVGGVPMALQAAMLVAVALALAFMLYHILALPVDLQMLPSWKWR